MNLDRIADHSRVLLLQGPVGPFFRRLADFLESRDVQAYKINFNGGDDYFYPPGERVFSFRGEPMEWRTFLERVLDREKIEAIVLFGDCRFYHRIAIRLARRRRLGFFVFEEGYVRPDYITLEQNGVNGFSRLPRDPAVYQAFPAIDIPPPRSVGTRLFWSATAFALMYGLAGFMKRWSYRYYRHHRPHFSLTYGLRWLLSPLRKWAYKVRDSGKQELFAGPLSRRYFLVPLQVFDDAQVVFHSPYRRVENFIDAVMESFARNADPGHHLVFKHHPMDRGLVNYRECISDLERKHALRGRVHYVHDLHLPTLLDHAIGTVVINSTVGLSSLIHGTPVKALGRAVFDLPGIAHQRPLDEFWRHPEPIDRRLFERFHAYLIFYTQVNGSFYLWRDFVFQGRQGRYAGKEQSAPLAPRKPIAAPVAGGGVPLARSRVPDRARDPAPAVAGPRNEPAEAVRQDSGIRRAGLDRAVDRYSPGAPGNSIVEGCFPALSAGRKWRRSGATPPSRSPYRCREQRTRNPWGAMLVYRQFWWATGLALVTAVIYLSLTPCLPDLGLAGSDEVGHLVAN